MKHLFLLSILLAASPVLAQTAQQKGIVRKITHSRQDPSVAVADVRVVVGGITSSKSDAKGKFSITVPVNRDKSFILQDVRIPASSGYILASPTIRKKIYLSPNELQIALITPEEKDQISKANYKSLFRKYRQQNETLLQQRNKLEDMQLELDENDAKYKQVTHQIDSLQNLINQYFDEKNKKTVTATLKDMAEELAITDYQSLDSIDARIYDLKKNGDWNTLSKMLSEVMNGNAAAYLQEGMENQKNAQAILDAAKQDLSRRFQRMEEAIHAYKMQYQNDSVSKYYKILVQADPENWDYLNAAGQHEEFYMANFPLALNYFKKALALQVEDSLKAIIHTGLANVYIKMKKYNEAMEQANHALEINERIYDKKGSAVAESHCQIATIYYDMKDDENAIAQYKQASKIGEKIKDEKDLWIFRTSLGIMNAEINRGNFTSVFNTLASLPLSMDNMDNMDDKFEDIEDADYLAMPIVNQMEVFLVSFLKIINAQPEDFLFLEEFLLELLDEKKECFGENHPEVAKTYMNLGHIYLFGHRYEKALENYDRGLKILRMFFGEKHADVADAYLSIGTVYIETEKYPEAEQNFSQALAILKNHHEGENHPEIAKVNLNIGITYLKSKKASEASEKFTESLNILKTVYGEKHKTVADACFKIGITYSNVKSPEAITYFKQALDIQQKIYGKHHSDIAETYLQMGFSYLTDNKSEAAIKSFEQALKIQKVLFGPVHAQLNTTHLNIGSSYLLMKDYPKAIEHFTKALDIQRELIGENHPLTANYYKIIGDVYSEAEQYTEALKYYGKYQKFVKNHISNNVSETTIINNTIGKTYFNAGDYPKAIDAYTATLNLLQAQTEKSNLDLANTYLSLGDVYAATGDFSKTLDSYTQSAKYLKAQYGDNYLDLSMIYGKMGNIYNMRKQYSEALKYYALSKDIQEKTDKKNLPELAILYINMGLAHYKVGNKEAALEDFTHCLNIQETLHLGNDDIAIKAKHYIKTVKEEIGIK